MVCDTVRELSAGFITGPEAEIDAATRVPIASGSVHSPPAVSLFWVRYRPPSLLILDAERGQGYGSLP